MNPEQQTNFSGNQPAAYDAQGRPLYYQPASPPNNEARQAKKASRGNNDTLSPELQARHDDSVKLYPELQFSKTEYVVIDIQRTIWGLAFIWLAAFAVFAVILLFVTTMLTLAETDLFIMFIIVIASGIACLAGGVIGQYVFRKSYLIVTNERIFAHIQDSPFSYRAQNVEIEHIEDCSFHQGGVLQMMLNYGTIRLSTVGDEQTYKFAFVARPAEQFKAVNRVVQVVDEDSPTKYRE
jgi:hypothetical protein